MPEPPASSWPDQVTVNVAVEETAGVVTLLLGAAASMALLTLLVLSGALVSKTTVAWLPSGVPEVSAPLTRMV